jgi:ankyrin repeat protein
MGEMATIADHMRRHTRDSLRQAEYMIIEGFDVNARDGLHWTPLHYAVLHGNRGATKVLLLHGAEVDARNADFLQTPLHIAAEKGFYSIAKALLINAADVHAVDREWNTPLSLAIENGRTKVAGLLRSYGAEY